MGQSAHWCEMNALLLDPFSWFALGLTMWAFWRLVNWVASGGHLPLRDRRGTATGFTAAGLSAQEFYQPSARQAAEIELQEAMRREDDDEGDPPQTGAGLPTQPYEPRRR
jgi:hypothetical protein